QVPAEWDIARVLHHIGKEATEQQTVHAVDLRVPTPYVERLGKIVLRIAVEHASQLDQNKLGHAFDLKERIVGWQLTAEHQHSFGNILGEIANPLKVIGDAQRSR